MISFTVLPVLFTVLQQVMELVCTVKNRKKAFKHDLEQLQLTLVSMDHLFKEGGTWCSNQRVLKEIEKKLEEAKVLVKKCEKIPSGCAVGKCCYSRKISKLDADLVRLCLQELIVENHLANTRILKNLEQLRVSVQQSSIVAQTPEHLEKVSTFAAALQRAKQGSESHTIRDLTSVPVLEAWTPPPSDFLKYNVNGVGHAMPTPAGIGGVCRDANGVFINCFHRDVGYSNALKAEALAIKEGLLVAADREHLRIYIESSCEMIIDILTQFGASNPTGSSSSISLDCPTEISLIINEILDFQDHFEKVFFCHTSKEGNYVAASLSSTAAIHPSPKFLNFQRPDYI